ncbi:MAG: LacI family DNA-binding transcriptional regulator [Ginsengibacter sp.]
MNKAITLKDLAVKLNMSVSTVSKALNDNALISSITRNRVKKLASEWNYTPNEVARHFKLNKTFTVGLIIPNMLDQFYALAINGVEDIAGIEKYNVIVSQSHENPEKEEKIVELMKRNRVDGLIIAITKETQDMTLFHKLEYIGIPVVFFARPPKENLFDSVTADNESGAFEATDFLIKKGHKRIAHLMGPVSMEVSHIRFNGYKKALQKNNIFFDPDLVKVVTLTTKSTFKTMVELMKLKNPPTGIFAFKNYLSLDAIEYLKRNNPSKIKKIDFTGFGKLPLLQYLEKKPVASIDENSYQIGLEAARLLFKKIDAHDKERRSICQQIKVPGKLVVH